MNRFGTISKCPTCDTNVYAAEQVIGPGRRMYHKFCLKCSSCAKVLAPGSFREHDFEPYCQTCHLREFSTQDLRFANVLPPSPTRRARLSPASTPPPLIRVITQDDAIHEEDEDEELQLQSSPRGGPELEDRFNTESPQEEQADLQGTNGGGGDSELHDRFPTNSNGRFFPEKDAVADDWDGQDRLLIGRSPSPTKLTTLPSTSGARMTTTTTTTRAFESPFRTYSARTGSMRPISPDATGISTASAPMGYIRTNVTGSPVQPVRQTHTGASITSKGTTARRYTYTPPGFSGTPSCPRCEKPVYFAEQVKSCGKTWHKMCLRCSECSTLLDPARVSDKDGVVLCRICYSKLHGPVGRGYGLIGKIS